MNSPGNLLMLLPNSSVDKPIPMYLEWRQKSNQENMNTNSVTTYKKLKKTLEQPYEKQ